MNKRVRIKRQSAKDASPISPLMQNYVKAVVGSAVGALDLDSLQAQVTELHVEMRIAYTIFRDLQASANLASASTESPRKTLTELIENLQTTLGHNLGLLTRIQVQGGDGELPEEIHPAIAMADGGDIDEGMMAAVFENLRAQNARSAEGDDFDEASDDMIENAMGEVDSYVDLTREETLGERVRRAQEEEDDVRSTGRTRSSARRRRST